jgi:hypothetical protein
MDTKPVSVISSKVRFSKDLISFAALRLHAFAL